MKKQIADYVKSLGGTTAYSGNSKTMFINDPQKGQPVESIEAAVYNHFGMETSELPFKLQTN